MFIIFQDFENIFALMCPLISQLCVYVAKFYVHLLYIEDAKILTPLASLSVFFCYILWTYLH